MRPLILLLLAVASARAGDDELQNRAEAACAKLSRALEAYLGPKFEAPVPVQLVDADYFVAFLAEQEKKFVPKGLLEVARDMGVRLKQLPPGFDLIKEQAAMIREAVAGLYDAERDTYFVARRHGNAATPFFTMTATHELVHAYRDVDKDYWPRVLDATMEDMDWAQAVRFLVEGDATLMGRGVGLAVLQGTPPGAAVAAVASRAAQVAAAVAADAERKYGRFPLVLRESLIAAYTEGMVFAAEVFKRGDKEALDRAYDRPPRSTEQVLHPEKYLAAEPDEPTVFSGGDPTRALGGGWTLLLANVMGEFDTRLLFAERLGREKATAAAAGWDGARYFFCRKEGEPSFLGLVSAWDSEDDAEEFAAAWCAWASVRDGQAREVFPGKSDRLVVTTDGLVAVRVDGRDVLVADGVPPARLKAVFASLASAQRAERTADARPRPRNG